MHLRGHGLAGARVAREQRRQAATLDGRPAHAPGVQHDIPEPGARRELVELLGDLVGQHQVVPGHQRPDAPRQPLEPGGVLGAGAGLEVVGGRAARPSAAACWLAARAARTVCSGLSRNWIISARGRGRRRRHPAPSSPDPGRGRRCWASGASTTTGTPRDHAGSHGREPTRTTGQATSANARTAEAPRSASTSTGPTTSAAPVSRHSRAATAAISAASSRGRHAAPGRARWARRRQRRVPPRPWRSPPTRSAPGRRTACTPACRARAMAGPLRQRRAAGARPRARRAAGRARRRSSRWPVTRSGTRSDRVRNGPLALLHEQQAAADERRGRVEARHAPRPRPGTPVASSSARPVLARRRETSSWRYAYSRSKRGSRSGASATSRMSTSIGVRPNVRATRRSRIGLGRRVRPRPRRARAAATAPICRPPAAGLEQLAAGPASISSTCDSGMYRPRNRSSGSGSCARRRSTAWRTRASTPRELVEQVRQGGVERPDPAARPASGGLGGSCATRPSGPTDAADDDAAPRQLRGRRRRSGAPRPPCPCPSTWPRVRCASASSSVGGRRLARDDGLLLGRRDHRATAARERGRRACPTPAADLVPAAVRSRPRGDSGDSMTGWRRGDGRGRCPGAPSRPGRATA